MSPPGRGGAIQPVRSRCSGRQRAEGDVEVFRNGERIDQKLARMIDLDPEPVGVADGKDVELMLAG